MSKPVFILSALVFLAPSMASGQESAVHPIIADKFMLNAGIFFPEKEFEVQVNGSSPGREIDFADKFRNKSSESTESANFPTRVAQNFSEAGQFSTINQNNTATKE